MKYKILQVHNYYQIPGGEDTVVANERKLLEKHGHTVIQYIRNNKELNDLSKFNKLLLPFNTIFNLKNYFEIKKVIKENNIDIVHVHNTLNLISSSVYYAALKCKVPVVQTIHNFRMLCPGATFYRDGHICEDCVTKGLKCAVKHGCYRDSKIQTLACVISTKIHRMTGIYGKINYICLTEFNREKLLLLNRGGKRQVVDEKKVFIKPNFVHSSGQIIPAEKRENQFIFVGRLDKLKGVHILFEAWKKMGQTAPKLLVCGTGPMEEWCKEFIANNNVNIELKGFVSNDEARRLVGISKALILPSQWYEGFPMSIVEAFSVGTPVITSEGGNTGMVVVNEITGYKFKACSIEELIYAVKNIEATDIIEWEKECLREYNNRYSSEQNYKVIIQIYVDIIMKSTKLFS
jgi:glycosyltransferase involved in cell wall biosynthesis